jgi:uncharacterized membrane protein YqiK
LTAKQLESQVRRPADAEAYRQRTLAEASRDMIKLETEAEAFKQRALAEAHRDTTKLNVEAEANHRRQIAEADADARRAHADADAYAERTTALAEAEAINARAQALEDGNQALIAANKLIEILPLLVDAAARGLAGSHLTVLNGTEGVNQAITGMVGQGLAIYESLRGALGTGATPELTALSAARDGQAA